MLMAKTRDKKLKDKGEAIRQPDANKRVKKKKVSKVKTPNAVPPAPVPLSDPSQALVSAPATTGSRAAVRGKEEVKDQSDQLSGYIVMCNVKTKPCFWASCRKEGSFGEDHEDMKLFLYDFNQRLLYGIYKAEFRGQLNLEPNAFGGKFPAQVRDLLSLFLPCIESTAASAAPMPVVAPPRAILLLPQYQYNRMPHGRVAPTIDRYSMQLWASSTAAPMPEVAQPHAILPPPEGQYYGMQHGCAGPMIDPHSMQHRVPNSHRELFGTEATMERGYPTLDHIEVCQLRMTRITSNKIKGCTSLKICPRLCTTNIPGIELWRR